MSTSTNTNNTSSSATHPIVERLSYKRIAQEVFLLALLLPRVAAACCPDHLSKKWPFVCRLEQVHAVQIIVSRYLLHTRQQRDSTGRGS